MLHTNCQIEALVKRDFNCVVSKPYILYTIIYCINLAVEKKKSVHCLHSPQDLKWHQSYAAPLDKNKEKIAPKKSCLTTLLQALMFVTAFEGTVTKACHCHNVLTRRRGEGKKMFDLGTIMMRQMGISIFCAKAWTLLSLHFLSLFSAFSLMDHTFASLFGLTYVKKKGLTVLMNACGHFVI